MVKLMITEKRSNFQGVKEKYLFLLLPDWQRVSEKVWLDVDGGEGQEEVPSKRNLPNYYKDGVWQDGLL